MRLGTRGQYAVAALADIALHGGRQPVSLPAIAARQDISLAYLEQLFVSLRQAKIVESARGPGGGYRLSRPAEEIAISEILVAVDESMWAMRCEGEIGEGCAGSRAKCLTHDLWERLSAVVHLFLQQTTLADVANRRLVPCPAVPHLSESATGQWSSESVRL
jgi:Rrf2 family iron-sulfur cluster assembly transcriptional regulator